MARWALAIATIWAALACAGEESQPLGEYGQLCDSVSSPCRMGLVCLNRLCTVQCSDPVLCQQALAGDTCVGGVCYTSCRDSFNCPQGLVCTMAGSTMGTCRPSP